MDILHSIAVLITLAVMVAVLSVTVSVVIVIGICFIVYKRWKKPHNAQGTFIIIIL